MDAFIVEGNVSLWYLWRYRWAFGLVGMRLVLCLLHQAQAPLCCLHPTCLTLPPSPSPSEGRMVGLCFSLFPIYSISIPNPVLPRPSSPGDSLAEPFIGLRNSKLEAPRKNTSHYSPSPATSDPPGAWQGCEGSTTRGAGFEPILFESQRDTEPQLTSGFHDKFHHLTPSRKLLRLISITVKVARCLKKQKHNLIERSYSGLSVFLFKFANYIEMTAHCCFFGVTESFLKKFIVFLLEYSWFLVLYQFLFYSIVIQSYKYAFFSSYNHP